MPDIHIISNTSCLIVLDNIGELSLLHKLYGTIQVPEEVAIEFEKPLPAWVAISKVRDKKAKKILANMVDEGEASTIALSLETNSSVVILDDLKARKIAENLELALTGTLGVILKAKEKGIIDAVEPMLQKLKLQGFRISQPIAKEILRLAGEL